MQIGAVNQVLAEIGAADVPQILWCGTRSTSPPAPLRPRGGLWYHQAHF